MGWQPAWHKQAPEKHSHAFISYLAPLLSVQTVGVWDTERRVESAPKPRRKTPDTWQTPTKICKTTQSNPSLEQLHEGAKLSPTQREATDQTIHRLGANIGVYCYRALRLYGCLLHILIMVIDEQLLQGRLYTRGSGIQLNIPNTDVKILTRYIWICEEWK